MGFQFGFLATQVLLTEGPFFEIKTLSTRRANNYLVKDCLSNWICHYCHLCGLQLICSSSSRLRSSLKGLNWMGLCLKDEISYLFRFNFHHQSPFVSRSLLLMRFRRGGGTVHLIPFQRQRLNVKHKREYGGRRSFS